MRQLLSITEVSTATTPATPIMSIPRRWGMSIVVIIGVAGVVAVLTSVMTMSFGLTETAKKSAREGWAIILRKGAFAESVSAIPRDSIVALESTPGIARDADGELAFERQYVTTIRQPRSDLDEQVMGSVLVRGLSDRGLAELDGFEIIEGLEEGELVATAGLQTLLEGMKVKLYNN